MLGSKKDELRVAGDFVIWEVGAEFEYCRVKATITVPANTTYEPGQVLEAGAYTADYDALRSGTAIAILFEKVVNDTASSANKTATVIFQGPAIVNKNELSDNDSTTLTELANVQIDYRDNPVTPS